MGTRYRGTEEENRALDTFIKLLRVVDTFTAAQQRQSPLPDNMTVSQFGVLEAVLHLGPLTQTELGKKILKTKGNMSLVIDNLEKQGLARRERSDEDRRKITVHLTERGRELIAGYFPEHARTITALMAVLSPEEQERLAELCKKLGNGILELRRNNNED